MRPILTTPVLAFCLAGAGALSSSAFVLPELKAKGWDERAEGTAALTVLLLQDIAVAPLLVILPLLAGSGPQSGPELGILVAKGTFGFGLVLAAGSVILRQIFAIVAATQSSETFVAAALLVAIGMGVAAEDLGLSTTTGAFAAGVLLAGSQYRQQIEADIKPFEGILLGIFFMTAGANLDPALCLQEWPTLLSGILAFLGAKLLILFAAGAFAFGLTRAEAIRIALLLAGGGEFAFVVFKLAEDLGLLPDRLEKLLTASVIISMSLTPLLAELAVYVGDVVERIDASGGLFGEVTCGIDDPQADALFDVIDADGSGSIDADELRTYLLGGGTAAATRDNASFETLFKTIDLNGDGVISRDELRKGYLDLVTGELEVLTEAGQSSDEASAELATAPDAVVVCGYGEMGQRACDVLADVEGIKSVESAVDTADYKERYTRSTTPTAEVNPMMAGLQNMMGGGAVPAAAGASEPSALVAQPPLVAERDELSTQFIAFDRNPSRVALGQDNRARVVYGDGASPVLLKAAGVDQPRAIVVTYANDKRVLEATRRLRDAYPDAPIYARGRTALDAESLLQAGATEVVVESVEAAVRFATLLGAPAEAADKLLRAPLTAESLLGDSATAAIDGNFGLRQAYGGLFGEAAAAAPPPYVAEQFGDLANECGTTVEAVRQLYGGFAALEANDDGEVELFAIRPMLVRTNDGPLDDATLQARLAARDRNCHPLGVSRLQPIVSRFSPTNPGCNHMHPGVDGWFRPLAALVLRLRAARRPPCGQAHCGVSFGRRDDVSFRPRRAATASPLLPEVAHPSPNRALGVALSRILSQWASGPWNIGVGPVCIRCVGPNQRAQLNGVHVSLEPRFAAPHGAFSYNEDYTCSWSNSKPARETRWATPACPVPPPFCFVL